MWDNMTNFWCGMGVQGLTMCLYDSQGGVSFCRAPGCLSGSCIPHNALSTLNGILIIG